MGWAHQSNNRNPAMMFFGVMLLVGLFMWIARGSGWPVFIFLIWLGPRLFARAFKTATSSGQADDDFKRKNDQPAQASPDDQAADPVGYLMTDDGEVMEIIDDRDRANRRDGGFI